MATILPTATPVMPQRGNGPRPRPSAPPTAICSTATANTTEDGTRILPVPRTTEASVLHSHTSMAPLNSTWP
jgi:hypothetical protein